MRVEKKKATLCLKKTWVFTESSASADAEEDDVGALGVVQQLEHLVEDDGQRRDAHAMLWI